jgi:hypothetical protein
MQSLKLQSQLPRRLQLDVALQGAVDQMETLKKGELVSFRVNLDRQEQCRYSESRRLMVELS